MRKYSLLFVIIIISFDLSLARTDMILRPGKAIGPYSLGMGIASVVKAVAGDYERYNARGKIFADVFKIKFKSDIAFDLVIVIKHQGLTLFFCERRMVAAVLRKNSFKLNDVASDNKISAIQFVFGNKYSRIAKSNTGLLLIYAKYGVAFIDDPRDDVVDGVIVFAAN